MNDGEQGGRYVRERDTSTNDADANDAVVEGHSGGGMSVGGGMGGSASYDPNGPLSTSMEDIGDDAGGSTGANRGSAGGRAAGAGGE